MTSHAHDCSGVQHIRSGHYFKAGFVRVAVLLLLTVSAAAGECEALDPATGNPLALTARAVACLSSGDLKSAEAMQNRTVSILKKGGAPELQLAGAWNLLGIIQRQAARLPNAEFALTQALRLYDRNGTASGGEIVNAAQNLATVSYMQGDYGKAERLFQRARSVWEECCTSDTLMLAHLLNNTAAMSTRLGRHDNAVVLNARAVELYRDNVGENHVLMANALNNLARSEAERRHYSQAEELYLRAAAIWEKLGLLTNPGSASLLGNYGALLSTLGRHAESETMHRRSLEVLRVCCGEEHPDFAPRLADYAHVLRKLKRKEEAASVAARAATLAQQRPVTGAAFTVDVQDLK